MTESEWLHASEPYPLLSFLSGRPGYERTVGRWIVACCRQIEHLIESAEVRKAILAGERYATEVIQRSTMQTHMRRVRRLRRELTVTDPTEVRQAYEAVSRALWFLTMHRFGYSASRVVAALVAEARSKGVKGLAADLAAPFHRRMVELLRDVVGNPFRPRAPGNPAWLDANGGLARRLATSIHDEQRFTECPILADALEDAGCTDTAILTHLRTAATHARGCWALAALLSQDPR